MSETHNLNAALSYTSQMATAAQQSVSSVETSIAGLQSGGVTGPTLNAMSQAMEAFNAAHAALQTAHNELRAHIAVQEAYAANQGAGTREFVTQD